MRNPEHVDQRAKQGFTLFEVLGAIALLAIVYTMLSTAAIRGLQTEGKSRRKLEASLIVDLEMAEIEMELDRGIMRPLGEEESETEDGLYLIRTEVAVFEMPNIETTARGPSSGPAGQRDAAPPPPFGDEAPLREIRVRVGWGDPDDEQFVERVTYGIDQAAIQLAAAAAPSPSGPRR